MWLINNLKIAILIENIILLNLVVKIMLHRERSVKLKVNLFDYFLEQTISYLNSKSNSMGCM